MAGLPSSSPARPDAARRVGCAPPATVSELPSDTYVRSRPPLRTPPAGGNSMSQSAFDRLSPAFPQRAPWGTASKLRAWQAEALGALPRDRPARLPRRRDPRRRQDHVRPPRRRRTAAGAGGAPHHRRGPHRAPQDAVGGRRRDASASGSTPAPEDGKRGRSRQYHGVAVTYAQRRRDAGLPDAHVRRDDARDPRRGPPRRRRAELGRRDCARPTDATRRLAPDAAPRSAATTAPIPFVAYAPGERGAASRAPTTTTATAVRWATASCGPCCSWSTRARCAGARSPAIELEAHLGEDNTKDVTAQAWRTALDPEGDWIPAVLRSRRPPPHRGAPHVPDAGGLVIATDQTAARAYARILARSPGPSPPSCSPTTRARGADRAVLAVRRRWMVAVRMVSEGVDVPRLAVGVYATARRRRCSSRRRSGASCGHAAAARSRRCSSRTSRCSSALAAEMERERDHVLDRESGDDDGLEDDRALLAEAEREDKASDDLAGQL